MSKYYKCTHCWRRATKSIGYFTQGTHYCNKHWEREVTGIRISWLENLFGKEIL